MIYVSGIHALNIEDSLETCGDWHTSALSWSNLDLRDSSKSVFGSWGIELNKKVPEHEELYNVANTLRAVLDLMSDGQVGYLRNFRDDFFCTDKYNEEFFRQVILLKDNEHWSKINDLMKREFMYEWDSFVEDM